MSRLVVSRFVLCVWMGFSLAVPNIAKAGWFFRDQHRDLNYFRQHRQLILTLLQKDRSSWFISKKELAQEAKFQASKKRILSDAEVISELELEENKIYTGGLLLHIPNIRNEDDLIAIRRELVLARERRGVLLERARQSIRFAKQNRSSLEASELADSNVERYEENERAVRTFWADTILLTQGTQGVSKNLLRLKARLASLPQEKKDAMEYRGALYGLREDASALLSSHIYFNRSESPTRNYRKMLNEFINEVDLLIGEDASSTEASSQELDTTVEDDSKFFQEFS